MDVIDIRTRAAEIAAALDRDGKIYRKVAQVRAERAAVETRVETILADGHKETENTAHPGDYIVTGVGGERYVVKPEVFEARYAPKPGNDGVFIALGQVVAVANPFGGPVSLLAPWGERQWGRGDCLLMDHYDPAQGQRAGQPYLISRIEFERTYRLVEV